MTNSRSYLSRTVAALLMISLATACGDSDSSNTGDAGDSADGSGSTGGTGGNRSTDGGKPTNPATSTDAPPLTPPLMDAAKTMDVATSTDAGKPLDVASLADVADAAKPPDAAKPLDVASSPDAGKAPGLPVNLGTAVNFVVLAKSGISTVPTSAVTGNLGVSPAAATYITGFSLTADSTNVFSTSPQVTGKIYAADHTPPTPSTLTTAVGDMEIAFTDAAARAPSVTELGAGNIGGMTLAPNVYKWGTGLLIPTNVTLTGNATDVWIFQIAQDLTMSSAAKILLAGGAVPKNIFWQVSGRVDLGTTAHCEGVVMTKTSITLRTGASIRGRLLAQTAVTIDGSTVVEPAR